VRSPIWDAERSTVLRTVCLLFGVLLIPGTANGSVDIQVFPDKSVMAKTAVYTARIDERGNLVDLVVKGAKALSHRFGDPGKPPAEKPSVNVIANMVAVRSGKARVEWTFGEDSIRVVTEGYNFECQIDPSAKAIVAPGGKGGPFPQYAGGSIALILSNDVTVSYAAMHVHGNRFLPPGYTNGSRKPGDLVEFELKLGAPAEAIQLLTGITLAAVGSRADELRRDGNQGGGFTHVAGGEKIAFTSSQQNLSAEKFDLEYRLSVLDHYVAGKEVAHLKQSAALAAGGKAELRWELPSLPPGFYYATVSAWRGTTRLTETKQTFAVDLANYTRPLTRPPDFCEFWKRQDDRLRATRPDPMVRMLSLPGCPTKAYEVTLRMPDSSLLRGCLTTTGRPTNEPAQLGSLVARALDAKIEKAKAPGFRSDHNVEFTIQLPQDATYTEWKSAEDNNLLKCVLCYLRAVDFLVPLREVGRARVQVNGASRSGPLAVITAALRPREVRAVDAFVHTSAGISWEDKPYSGWGVPGGHNPSDPQQVRRLAAMAAYVDPVNHAPDVKCPILFGYGLDDTLSPPQGIEAMYHLAGSAWKRISRDAGGHQYSPGYQLLQKQLNALLNAGGAQPSDQSTTLKEH